MAGLRYFNKERYSDLGEALSDIRRELQALQVQDSSTVVWNKSANGMSARVGTGAVGETAQEAEMANAGTKESAYKGAFSVSFNADKTKLLVKGGHIDIYGVYYPDTELNIYADDVIGVRADWSDAEKKYLIQVSSNSNGWKNKPYNQFNQPHIQFAHTVSENGEIKIVQDWTRNEVHFRELFIV